MVADEGETHMAITKKHQAAYLEALAVEAARVALAERMASLQPEIASLLGDYLHFIRGMLCVASAYRRRSRRDFVKLLKQIRQDDVLPDYSDEEVLAWLKECDYSLPCNPFPLIPARLMSTARVVALRIASGTGRRALSPAVPGEIEKLFSAVNEEELRLAFSTITERLRQEAIARRFEEASYSVDPDTGEILFQ